MATTKNDQEDPAQEDPSKAIEDAAPPKDSWVQCDSCNKWRRIPAIVADQLDENVPWHCQDNPNAAFASCGVTQELSNEEIDQQQEEEQVGISASAMRLQCAHETLCMEQASVQISKFEWYQAVFNFIASF